MRVAVYSRVSTSHQSTDNQRLELERVAASRGWTIVANFTDDGISGSKGRADRPALDALLKGATRRQFDLIAVWSVDRLGRSLQHLVETVNELHAVGVDLYVHQQAIDTSTPAGKLAFARCDTASRASDLGLVGFLARVRTLAFTAPRMT